MLVFVLTSVIIHFSHSRFAVNKDVMSAKQQKATKTNVPSLTLERPLRLLAHNQRSTLRRNEKYDAGTPKSSHQQTSTLVRFGLLCVLMK